ncbi:MAG: hypothetical protein JO247_09310 [Chloroflexi bacterium]|nr:hypothetical protein [Chloroflexota bacterium]
MGDWKPTDDDRLAMWADEIAQQPRATIAKAVLGFMQNHEAIVALWHELHDELAPEMATLLDMLCPVDDSPLAKRIRAAIKAARELGAGPRRRPDDISPTRAINAVLKRREQR